jgi:hypothetical protein
MYVVGSLQGGNYDGQALPHPHQSPEFHFHHFSKYNNFHTCWKKCVGLDLKMLDTLKVSPDYCNFILISIQLLD